MTQNSRVPLRRERNRRPTLPTWLLGTLIAVFLGATFLSAYLVFSTVRDFVAGWKITGPGLATPAAVGAITATAASANSTPNAAGTAQPGGTPVAIATPVPTVSVQSWSGTSRVTILVLGIDRRAGEDE